MEIEFIPFPEIISQRLFLRNLGESDCEEILFLRSDNTINKYIERPEHRKTKNVSDAIKFINEQQEHLKNNVSITWGITLHHNSKVIGTICLWNFSEDDKTAEVGYNLDTKFQRKGIMNEALKTIVEFGFNKLKLKKIEAFTHIENKGSKRLLEKNGFHFITNRRDMDNQSNIIFELENASNLQHR